MRCGCRIPEHGTRTRPAGRSNAGGKQSVLAHKGADVTIVVLRKVSVHSVETVAVAPDLTCSPPQDRESPLLVAGLTHVSVLERGNHPKEVLVRR